MNAGFGCLVLFMLPFAAVGLVTAVQAVRSAAAGDWAQAAFLSVFALTFGGVGSGGIAAAFTGRRKLAEREAVKARHPGAPWLWRADWAAGRVEDAGRVTMWFAWSFAGLWNLISFPAAFFVVREAMQEGKGAALLALLFPAIGIGLLVWAIRATIRFRRYGVSRLVLATLPAAVGRSLSGTVEAPASLRPAEEFLVVLTCVRRVVSGSGKNRSTREETLWQDEQRISGRPSRTAAGMSSVIPVSFPLPPDARPCDDANPKDRVLWRLAVSAEVPGVDYSATFEVPVFRTGESDLPRTPKETAAAAALVPSVESYRQPHDSRILVSRNQRGTEILFPAARNPGAAIGLTGFLLIWGGAFYALLYFDAPMIFPIVFGALGLLLLWAAVDMWLRVTRVVAGDGSVTVASGLLGTGRERRLAAAEIAEVTTRIGMQAGGTPYYDVVLVRRDGKRVTAGPGVRDKREAEWVAATLREAMKG